jgi:hypothetical protein
MLLRNPSCNEIRNRLPRAVYVSLMGEDAISQRHREWPNAYSRTARLMDDGINRRAAERAEHTLSATYGVL